MMGQSDGPKCMSGVRDYRWYLRHGEAREQALEEAAVVQPRQPPPQLALGRARRADVQDVLARQCGQEQQPHLQEYLFIYRFFLI
jgi:hypothetical protein